MIGEAIREYYLSTLIIKSAKRKPNVSTELMELSGNRLRRWHHRQNKLERSGNKQKSQRDELSAISTGFGLIVD